MRRPVENCGYAGWAAILSFCVGFDYWALKRQRQTLSSGLWALQARGPATRAAVLVGWVVLTSHLFAELDWQRRLGLRP